MTTVASEPMGAPARKATTGEPGRGGRAEGVATTRVAYLTTSYPKVSHTFIRREIAALETMGFEVLRLAIRSSGENLADEADRAEAKKTTICLEQGAPALLGATLAAALSTPGAFLRACRAAMRMSGVSERGLIRHLAYIAEACWIARLLKREAIAHVHVHFGTNPASVARLVRLLGGPTYSFTVHGPDELDGPRAHSLGAKIIDAAFVVAITDYCGAQLRRWAPREHWKKIRIVRCSVGEKFFDAAAPVDENADTLVCVGRLSGQKGQLLLIDAFERLVRAGTRARLVLAGDGEMRAEIEARIAEAGLQDRVRITGWIDEAEVRRLLLASRALVLPSFAEGLPVVIMEALALGRPVISTYIAGIPELVRPGENGWLVPAGNIEALEAAMRAVFEASPARLSEMGRAGGALVRERHHTLTETARLAARFRETLREGGHG